MDEFGVLVESIGFKAHGKSAPMAKLKPKPESHFADNTSITTPAFNDSSSLPVDELDGIFKSNLNIDKTRESQKSFGGDYIFGGPVSSSNQYGEIDFESVLNSSSNRSLARIQRPWLRNLRRGGCEYDVGVGPRQRWLRRPDRVQVVERRAVTARKSHRAEEVWS
ncbi:hypothetical protein DH2020_007190 [Rehmannia glutinosa]|uniref:Auxilin-like protein n=1 Tax=Rehmannia glutinosa TaxID=99300 RepID=A0ABR0TXB2_REHGL